VISTHLKQADTLNVSKNRYMATLRQQNRNLPALKDELAKARL